MTLFLLFILCSWLLLVSYISNNPLISCFSLIMSLVLISPVLVGIIPSWIIYLFIILFMTGILVVVLYFSSVGAITLIYLPRSLLLLLVPLLSFPFMITSVGGSWISSLFSLEVFTLLIIVVLCLSVLVVFASYMLSHSSAIRSI